MLNAIQYNLVYLVSLATEMSISLILNFPRGYITFNGPSGT